MVRSLCLATFTSPGPKENNKQFLRSSSYTSNQTHYLKVSQHFLLALFSEFFAFTMFHQWTNSTELKYFYSLFPDCSASWDHKEDKCFSAFIYAKSSMEIICCPGLSASNQQASCSQNQGLSSQRLPDQADSKELSQVEGGNAPTTYIHWQEKQ